MATKETVSLRNHGPFKSLLAATAASGSLSLIFSAPLAVALAEGKDFVSIAQLFNCGIFDFWKAIVKSTPASILLPVSLLLATVLGFLVKPIEQFFTAVATGFSSLLLSKALLGRWFMTSPLFTPAFIFKPESIEVLGWLISKRDKRIHWEWEYFHYQLAWSLFFNNFAFFLLALLLLKEPVRVAPILILPSLLCFLYGIARNKVMGLTHDHYAKSFRRSKRRTTSPCAETET